MNLITGGTFYILVFILQNVLAYELPGYGSGRIQNSLGYAGFRASPRYGELEGAPNYLGRQGAVAQIENRLALGDGGDQRLFGVGAFQGTPPDANFRPGLRYGQTAAGGLGLGFLLSGGGYPGFGFPWLAPPLDFHINTAAVYAGSPGYDFYIGPAEKDGYGGVPKLVPEELMMFTTKSPVTSAAIRTGANLASGAGAGGGGGSQ